MKKILQTCVIGAVMTMGVGAIASSPAQAASLSLTGASISGSTPLAANDYLIYDSNGTKTYGVDKTPANLQKVLDGNSTSPTGNVELRASTEKLSFTTTDFTANTTLSGTIGGKSLTLSSLTSSDWNNLYKGTGLTFGRYWFNQALTANGLSSLVGTSTTANNLFNAFVLNKGFQRFSDPNISYVNQDDSNGVISIGLAGHYNATSLLLPIVPTNLQPLLLGKTLQASEIVKYTYDNGDADYLFSFQATKSGLVETDGKSHNGNYEVSFQGVAPVISSPQAVPEPSIVLGLLGVGGIFATKRKFKKVSG